MFCDIFKSNARMKSTSRPTGYIQSALYQLFGCCELWNLSRTGLKSWVTYVLLGGRTLGESGSFRQTRCYIFPLGLFCTCLPVYDKICRRSTKSRVWFGQLLTVVLYLDDVSLPLVTKYCNTLHCMRRFNALLPDVFYVL